MSLFCRACAAGPFVNKTSLDFHLKVQSPSCRLGSKSLLPVVLPQPAVFTGLGSHPNVGKVVSNHEVFTHVQVVDHTKSLSRETQRNVDITLLLDLSGSMSGA